MNRRVQVNTPLPPSELLFRSMHGEEALSTLFEFDVDMVSESAQLDLRQLLSQSVTLRVDRGWSQPRFLNGQVVRCKMVGRATPTSRHYVYRATLRPWLWYLTQTKDSKIFQEQSVPDVIREVLAEYDHPVEFKLSGSYRKWDYCVQYEETDFAFISRLMEHEGMYYWFRHEEGAHTLIITDDVAHHEPFADLESIPYFGPDRVVQPDREYVSRWEPAEQVTPGSFATADYDFKKPAASLDVLRSNPGPYSHGDLEVYEWMGGYTDPDQGEHYSRVRLEGLQARQSEASGQSNSTGLAPGYLVTLSNHPRLSENREYLVRAARYCIQESGYSTDDDGESLFEVEFIMVPATIPFRAPRVTPLPRTHGPQTAKVVGKPGEQIWTDHYGCVKVQFRWDRYGKKNENSSCWVRVSSPWAGGGFGGIQLPRVDDEVIVDFIGGHPDRPIIIGRVYNASNMPPWDLPGNATQSGFLSRSKDGDRSTANALMFEDRAGMERIWLHAERDLATEVEANETHTVEGDRTTLIMGSDALTVMGVRTSTTHGHESETFLSGADRTVTGDVNETVTGNETRTFVGDIIETITGNVDETITGDLTQTTTGMVTRTITGDVTDETTGNVDETITGDLTQTTTGAVTRTITGAVTDETTGAVSETVTGDVASKIDGTLDQTVTGSVTINAQTDMTVTTPKWTVNVTGPTSFWQDSYAHGTPMRLNVVGLSADAWGMRGQVYGVNAQWALVKLDGAKYKDKSGLVEMKKDVVRLTTAAAAKIQAGGAYVSNQIINLFT